LTVDHGRGNLPPLQIAVFGIRNPCRILTPDGDPQPELRSAPKRYRTWSRDVMDQTAFIHVPGWVKRTALVLLLVTLLLGLGLGYYSFLRSDSELLSSAISVVQFSAYGAVAALVILYTERETSVRRLSRRLDEFFLVDLRNTFASIRIPTKGLVNGAPVSLSCSHENGQPRAFYCITYNSWHLLVQVDANIQQILVMYHYPCSPSANAEDLNRHFAPVIEQAKNAGWIFTSVVAQERFDGLHYFELFFRMKMDKPFLMSAPDVFYWLTDISLMTRTAMLNGIESGVLRRDDEAPQLRWCDKAS
jgi:hypothetical protein